MLLSNYLLTYDIFLPLLLHYSTYSLNTISKGLVNPSATHMYIIDIEVTLSTPQSDVTSKSALKVDLGGPVCWEDTKGPFFFTNYIKTVSLDTKMGKIKLLRACLHFFEGLQDKY